jgi:hypothetical protein
MGRSAKKDVLVFYFSGHGIALGSSDFGFCTKDTVIHPETGAVISVSVVKFSEIINSLKLVDVIPIFIIDACFSGQIAKGLVRTSKETIGNMQDLLQTSLASSYALLCSCGDTQYALEHKDGGIFSKSLTTLGEKGINNKRNNYLLTIKDIFPELEDYVTNQIENSSPKCLLGQTLPDIPLILNPLYKATEISLSQSYINIIIQLWNNGENRVLSPSEILKLCGRGAYGNHNKLSLKPWRLLENVGKTNKRRLTPRGILFVQNKLEVPKTITEDPIKIEFVAKKPIDMVYFKDLNK